VCLSVWYSLHKKSGSDFDNFFEGGGSVAQVLLAMRIPVRNQGFSLSYLYSPGGSTSLDGNLCPFYFVFYRARHEVQTARYCYRKSSVSDRLSVRLSVRNVDVL